MFIHDRNVRIAVPANVDLTGATCVLAVRNPVTAAITPLSMTVELTKPLMNTAGITLAQPKFWAYYDTSGTNFSDDIGDWEAQMIADWVAGAHYSSPIFTIPVKEPLA